MLYIYYRPVHALLTVQHQWCLNENMENVCKVLNMGT